MIDFSAIAARCIRSVQTSRGRAWNCLRVKPDVVELSPNRVIANGRPTQGEFDSVDYWTDDVKAIYRSKIDSAVERFREAGATER